MRIRDEDHEDDHGWIKAKRKSESEWSDQWKRVRWTVITTLITGATLSLFAALWYAVQAFVERGGA